MKESTRIAAAAALAAGVVLATAFSGSCGGGEVVEAPDWDADGGSTFDGAIKEDAGRDAGKDAGRDSGSDGGLDASADAGTDAGQPPDGGGDGDDDDGGGQPDSGDLPDAGGDDAGGVDAGNPDAGTVTLASVAVTPVNPSIAKNTSLQFSATGTYSDGSTRDITTQVTWASTGQAVATISNAAGTQGLATGVGPGSTAITAALASQTGSTTLTVTDATLASIAVTPTNPSIAKGTTIQFAATGTYSDGTTQDLTTQVTWASTGQAVATISNAAGTQGLATGVGAGSTAITAAMASQTGTTTLTVTSATLASIAVTPTNPTIATGTTIPFTATGTYSDGSTQDLTAAAGWASSSPTVAVVSNAAGSQGLATGVAAGRVTITAALSGVSGSTTLTVTSAALQSIIVAPVNATIALGTSRQYNATGLYADGSTQNLTAAVSWSSGDVTVATISNAAGSQGLATAVGTGSTTVVATLSGVSGTAALTVTAASLQSIGVTPAAPSIVVGSSLQFHATGTYSDGSTQDLTTQVSWSSTNLSVATISNAAGTQGLATGVGAGNTAIRASLSGVNGSTSLTVTLATLDSIAVTPVNPSLKVGYQLQFKATGTYSDGSTADITGSVTWISSNTAIATISNAWSQKGLATGVADGSTTISAALSGRSDSTTLTVTSATLASITVTPASVTLDRRQTQQMTATGTFSDGSTQDLTTQVTWSTADNSVATVSQSGLVTAGGKGGVTTVTATKSGKAGTATITVQ